MPFFLRLNTCSVTTEAADQKANSIPITVTT